MTRYLSALRCGHTLETTGAPRPGFYVTCPSPRCQVQRRVTAVVLAPTEREPVRAGVQGALFELGEAA